MFNYFGSKRKHAHRYPAPRYPLIIEPFCGAAAYSCLHRTRQVLLNDIDPVIAGIWKWIINATEEDIRALPDAQENDNLNDFNLGKAQRNLLAFCFTRGSGYGANVLNGWAFDNEDANRMKRRLLEMSFGHWNITNVDYTLMPNIEATWYIDPPYIREGKGYKHHKIDYKQLGEWCRTRKGQVIVCESEFGDWLPFRTFYRNQGMSGKWSTECIWTSD